jgi:hypothetical protein
MTIVAMVLGALQEYLAHVHELFAASFRHQERPEKYERIRQSFRGVFNLKSLLENCLDICSNHIPMLYRRPEVSNQASRRLMRCRFHPIPIDSQASAVRHLLGSIFCARRTSSPLTSLSWVVIVLQVEHVLPSSYALDQQKGVI